jgi:hypothetical protein
MVPFLGHETSRVNLKVHKTGVLHVPILPISYIKPPRTPTPSFNLVSPSITAS